MSIYKLLFLLVFASNLMGIILMTVERLNAEDYGALASNAVSVTSLLICPFISGLLLAIMMLILLSGEDDPQAIYFISGAAFKGGTNWMFVFGALIFGTVLSGFIIQLVSSLFGRLFAQFAPTLQNKSVERMINIVLRENDLKRIAKIYEKTEYGSDVQKVAEQKIQEILAKITDPAELTKIINKMQNGTPCNMARERRMKICKHDWNGSMCERCGMFRR